MVLPAGTTVPPLPHLLVLAAGAAVVGWQLRRRQPRFSGAVVLALAPWMVVGAALHVGYQLGLVPAPVAPLFGSPAVYLTTAVVAGGTWLAADAATATPERALGGAGTGLLVLSVSAVLGVGGIQRLAVPLVGLVLGVALGAGTWVGLGRLRPTDVATTGRVGLLVLVAHGLDGASTALGVDVLGFGERTPASRAIMELAAALPTAEVIGVGWLFVLVKLAVAAAVVVLFADFVREDPGPGYALLGLIAAVGLGPGTHNLLLYVVASV